MLKSGKVNDKLAPTGLIWHPRQGMLSALLQFRYTGRRIHIRPQAWWPNSRPAGEFQLPALLCQARRSAFCSWATSTVNWLRTSLRVIAQRSRVSMAADDGVLQHRLAQGQHVTAGDSLHQVQTFLAGKQVATLVRLMATISRSMSPAARSTWAISFAEPRSACRPPARGR